MLLGTVYISRAHVLLITSWYLLTDEVDPRGSAVAKVGSLGVPVSLWSHARVWGHAYRERRDNDLVMWRTDTTSRRHRHTAVDASSWKITGEKIKLCHIFSFIFLHPPITESWTTRCFQLFASLLSIISTMLLLSKAIINDYVLVAAPFNWMLLSCSD